VERAHALLRGGPSSRHQLSTCGWAGIARSRPVAATIAGIAWLQWVLSRSRLTEPGTRYAQVSAIRCPSSSPSASKWRSCAKTSLPRRLRHSEARQNLTVQSPGADELRIVIQQLLLASVVRPATRRRTVDEMSKVPLPQLRS
jgi:hypothetical protein